jgi:hypothetical protein
MQQPGRGCKALSFMQLKKRRTFPEKILDKVTPLSYFGPSRLFERQRKVE